MTQIRELFFGKFLLVNSGSRSSPKVAAEALTLREPRVPIYKDRPARRITAWSTNPWRILILQRCKSVPTLTLYADTKPYGLFGYTPGPDCSLKFSCGLPFLLSIFSDGISAFSYHKCSFEEAPFMNIVYHISGIKSQYKIFI